MTPIKTWLLVALSAPSWCAAQSMALSVVGSSGGVSVAGGHALSWTLGETAILAGEQGEDYLGSGFQQAKPRNVVVGVFQPYSPTVQLQIYPNPAADYVTVKSKATDLTIQITDLLGRPVVVEAALDARQQINLSHLPEGMYILQAFDRENKLVATAKIQHFAR